MVRSIKLIGMIVIFAMIFNSSIPITYAAANLEEGIIELSEKISKNMTDNQRRKIAIIEFSDLDGNITAFGQYLAEKLITQLFINNPGQFEVVERRQLMKVLGEQKLTMSGLLDSEAMKNVGQILGIDAIVTGSLTDLGNDVDVNARMIGIDTARVFAVAATKIPKVGTVKVLIEKMAAPVQTFGALFGSETSGAPQVNSVAPSITPPKPDTQFQEFQKFRVEVESLKVLKRNYLTVSLKYINKTPNDLNIGLLGPNYTTQALHQHPTYLTDDNGNEYRLREASGISSVRDQRGFALKILPNQSSTVSLKFGGKNVQVGTTFSFSSAQGILLTDNAGELRRKKNNWLDVKEPFNISIQNIKPNE